jgi:hypothetical protein
MDFGELLRVLGRRWRVSVPGLLLALAAAAAVAVVWPPTYQSDAEITLVGSKILANEAGNGNNPYVAVGNLMPLANILASNLSSDQAIQRLKNLGVTDQFTAQVPATAGGPFVEITVTGKNAAVVRSSIGTIINFSNQQLIDLQETSTGHTPQKGLIEATVIAPASKPVPAAKKKIELVAGVGILCLLVVFLLSISAESRARRRAGEHRSRGNDNRDYADHPDDSGDQDQAGDYDHDRAGARGRAADRRRGDDRDRVVVADRASDRDGAGTRNRAGSREHDGDREHAGEERERVVARSQSGDRDRSGDREHARTEAPRAEAPRTESPRAESPRAESPRTEAPLAELPRSEQPRAGLSPAGLTPSGAPQTGPQPRFEPYELRERSGRTERAR